MAPGQRVGAGWHGGIAAIATPVAEGIFRVPGSGSHHRRHFRRWLCRLMVARASALARVPEELSPEEAAPLMCAGITTFNGLRNSGARPGDVVAVLGLGGLGHLGVQFAARMGLKTIAIARGRTRSRWPDNSAHGITSTANHRMPPRSNKSWAARK